MQSEGLVPLKLNQQDGHLVVTGHSLSLVVQPSRDERLLQVADGFALHTHLWG